MARSFFTYCGEHHREIIAEARARVEQWRVEGFFGKAMQHSQHSHEPVSVSRKHFRCAKRMIEIELRDDDLRLRKNVN